MHPRLLIPLCFGAAALGFWAAQLGEPPSELPTRVIRPNPDPTIPLTQAAPSRNPDAPGPNSTPNSSPPPTSPTSILDIIRAAENLGLAPADARLRFMEMITAMGADELEALLREEAASPDFFRRTRFEFQFAAERLSEIAPQRAAELWLSSPALRFQTEALLSPWATRDPQAFVAWSLSLPPDAQQATSAVFGAIAKHSPEQFTALAPLVASSPAAVPAARAAIEALLEKKGKNSSPDTALSLARSLPEGAMRNAALAQLAKWPNLSLEGYPEIARAIESLPRSDAQRLGRDLAAKADQLPPGFARQSAFAGNLRELTQKNPVAAAEKLNTLAGSADYAAATRGFVEETSRNDPKSAIQWALSIPTNIPDSANQRLLALDRAARSWMRSSPEEARAWVASAPLSDREYLILTGTQRAR
jgi:hypothetical protein